VCSSDLGEGNGETVGGAEEWERGEVEEKEEIEDAERK